MKVVITDWSFPDLETERQLLSEGGHVVEDHQCSTEEEVARVVRDADVVMVQWAPVKEKAIAAMERCRGIISYGIGLDNVDLEAAEARGITVKNVPDYCLGEVADHAMALLLALQRQVVAVWEQVRRGQWPNTPPRELPPLRQCTLGLVGLGRIARRMARRAQAFGMQVMAYDPEVARTAFEETQVRAASLEDLWRASDLISLHCPLNEETHHLIDARALEVMKTTALLVNTSRGGLVDTADLREALQGGQIAGAALDVVEEEPLSGDHPLLEAPNLIVTSHVAWYSTQSIRRLQRLATEKAMQVIEEA